MLWPSWLWIGTRAKFSLWLANRLTTWSGSFYFWRRFRSTQRVWLWLLIINVLSWGALALLFYWMHVRRLSH